MQVFRNNLPESYCCINVVLSRFIFMPDCIKGCKSPTRGICRNHIKISASTIRLMNPRCRLHAMDWKCLNRRPLFVVINFYSTVSTGTELLMWMGNANREKSLLFTFHIIQLALFILQNHKPISGLMSAEIFLCWIRINSVICLSWGIYI